VNDTIFNKLVEFSNRLQKRIERVGTLVDEGHNFDWPNFVYTSNRFRRAHLDIVDVRETKKLYMMHLCIFPHFNDFSPIFGLDLIAGPNKVTGAFHDFSISDNHYMSQWFANKVTPYGWSKERQLPEWAKNIFSPSMVAAGNIQDTNELDSFIKLTEDTLYYYLENVGGTKQEGTSFKYKQNYYCQNQKQNPHTPRVMESLGLEPDVVKHFIEDCLFPEIA
jgi:hypothetical protein